MLKSIFTWNDAVRDLLIVVAIFGVMYIGANITPVTIDTIVTGEAAVYFFTFLLGKVDPDLVRNFFVSLEGVFAVAGLFFFGAIFWVMMKTKEIEHAEEEKFAPIYEQTDEIKILSVQWKVVLNHVDSENPAEWKIAILEADNMLDEILEDQGYFGETVADKLKAMSRTRIASYDSLWEAHKLRNEIAHGGAIDMELTKKMVRDTVAKFENAFKELGYL